MADAHLRAGPDARGKGLRARLDLELDDVDEPRPAPVENIPWGYGHDRLTAMVVDPDNMYVCWEVTDPSIEAARKRLGPAGDSAWLNLRVYDTTGRLFDGTNAHSYFDQRLERHDRQWFFHVGRPSSVAVVEVGLMSSEGYFAAVTRSGRVEFPRSEPLPQVSTEWMTVRVETGDVVGSTQVPSDPAVSGPAPNTSNGQSYEALSRHQWIPLREFYASHMAWLTDDISWEQFFSMAFRVNDRATQWTATVNGESWEAGPFSYPVEFQAPMEEYFEGPTEVYQVNGETRVVYGPWRVVVHGLGAHRRRLVVSSWQVHRHFSVEGAAPEWIQTRVKRLGASDQWLGASERRWLGASELRFGGASELYFLGASGLMMMGATERRFSGASQWLMRGASERRFAGASEWRLGGASERLGASERSFAGASEQRLAAEGYPSVDEFLEQPGEGTGGKT